MSLVDEWLVSSDFSNAYFTSAFARQLDDLTVRSVINPFAVLDEIRALEGRRSSRTKKATAFKGGLLDGLMHKHFFNARHMAKNIQNYWSPGSGRTQRAFKQVIAESSDSVDLWQLAGKLADRYVSKAFEHKNKEHSLTGDWIVYKRYNGKNYFLCLAIHDETNEDIFDRFATAAEQEFPELGIHRRNT